MDDELEQARQLDGLLQALDDRPWIAGTFMWAYRLVDGPVAADGQRSRIAEGVTARIYGALTGKP